MKNILQEVNHSYSFDSLWIKRQLPCKRHDEHFNDINTHRIQESDPQEDAILQR